MRSKIIKWPLNNKYMLLRHGQTEANSKKIYMGRLDYSLDETGVAQATAVELPFAPDLILHSPLKRTKQTAELVTSSTQNTIKPDARLIEKSGGTIEGKPYQEIAEKHPDIWGVWETETLEYIVSTAFPGGESDFDVAKRIEDLIAELERTYSDKNILLVTHSGVMQATRYLFGHAKDSIYFQPVLNCQIDSY